MTAFIEYDEGFLEWERYGQSEGKPLPPPFGEGSNATCLTWGGGFRVGKKDYQFFGAIAGVRNANG